MNFDTEQSSRRRVYLALGGMCLLTGFALISVSLYGALRSGEPERWIYVRPQQGAAAPVVAGAAATPGPPLGDAEYRIIVEKLAIDAPVAAFGLDENGVPEVPYEPDLVVWYDFSARPGTGGNAVFAGHRTWRGDAVFRRLEELSAGDKIVLKGQDGVQLVYQVFDTELVDPTEASARRWMDATDSDVITLITCGGDYRKTDDPIFGAEYDKRQVVRASLVGLGAEAPPQDVAAGG